MTYLNHYKRILSLLMASFILASCSNSETTKAIDNNNTQSSEMATQVFKNGAVYTVNPQQQWANAVAIKDNTIIFVGSDSDADKYIDSNTVVTDLAGKMMMPGFHDVHIHPIESASENTLFGLNTEQTNPENFANAIAQAAQDNPNASWLIGAGHDIFTLLGAQRSPKAIIDDVVADRPVIIMEQTSHSMWVNSAALALAGIDQNSQDPIGGVIVRDEITGLPNGILMDNAGNIIMDIAMQPTAQSRQNDYDGLVEFTLPELAKHGITSISDARSFWQRGDHLTWQKAAANNQLTARVAVGLWAYPAMNDVEQIAQLKALYQNEPDSLLKFNQIKFYSDGILSNSTAAMKQPYEIDLIGLAGNKGLNYFSQTRLEHYISQLVP